MCCGNVGCCLYVFVGCFYVFLIVGCLLFGYFTSFYFSVFLFVCCFCFCYCGGAAGGELVTGAPSCVFVWKEPAQTHLVH